MLRKKFIVILGVLALLLIGMAVASLWPLNRVFYALDHIESHSSKMIDLSNTLNVTISTVEVELYKLQAGETNQLDRLIEAVDKMRHCSLQLSQTPLFSTGQAQQAHERCQAILEQFTAVLGTLVTTPDPKLRLEYNIKALGIAARLREHIMELVRLVNQLSRAEQTALNAQFRWMVVGIALAFLVVINVCVMVMIHAAQMVLRPVDKLVTASRELARENFAYRVEMDRRDEFGDLAQAYNYLAQQLQENEQRRLEALGQMALALNHELNNAMAIIEMQLTLLKRRSDGDPDYEKRLEQIRASLERMSRTVASLKQIRRIVLTEYASGQKMLDLEQSRSCLAES